MPKKKKENTPGCYAVAVVSDTHINSTVGLNPPVSKLDEGSYHSPPEIRWLWNNWLDFWSFFGDITKTYGAKGIGVFNGDTIDLDVKGYSGQVITRNTALAHQNAADALLPAIDRLDGAFFVRGTEAHVGVQAQHEEQLAADFDNTIKDPERDSFTWWEVRTEIGGVRFDVAHHWSMGRLPWTEKNAANKLAFMLEYNYLSHGLPLPDVAIRGHNHRKADSHDNYEVRALLCGAWQLKTAYAHRISVNGLADIGGYIFICQGGEYEIIKRFYKPAKGSRKWQKIEKMI